MGEPRMNLRVGAKPVLLFAIAWVAAVVFSACSGSTSPTYEPIPPSEGRVMHHGLGETVVPKTPQRVILLGSVMDALALGVQPVGAGFSGIQIGRAHV